MHERITRLPGVVGAIIAADQTRERPALVVTVRAEGRPVVRRAREYQPDDAGPACVSLLEDVCEGLGLSREERPRWKLFR